MFLAQPCLLCEDTSHATAGGLCGDCFADLPALQGCCRACGTPMITPGLCGQCSLDPPPFDTCLSAYRYRYPVDIMIKKIKYQCRFDMLRPLCSELISSIRTKRSSPPECIVPVPMHRDKLRARGFNQAIELGKIIGRALNIPLDLRLLRRMRSTQEQHGLNPSERRGNVRGAFSLAQAPVYKSIALIDDVVTTGATVTEIASLLKKGGVEMIAIWSLARATPNKN